MHPPYQGVGLKGRHGQISQGKGLLSGNLSLVRNLSGFLVGALSFLILLSGCSSKGHEGPSAPPTPTSTSGVIGSSSKTKQEPTFTVVAGEERRELTRGELLSHQALETLTFTDKAAFAGSTLTVKAIPLTVLFEGLKVDPEMEIEFDALDGFSASLDPSLLLNRDPKRALAYLAVEEPEQPWPKLAKGGTAGPFYLVWKNPEASKVGQEQWPFQLLSFRITEPMERRFPAVSPAASLSPHDPIRSGYELFLKNCFACHTLNGEGNGRLGPDLNQPYSPTEYMKEEYLKKLVRDPQSVRQWKGSRMSSFSVETLSDAELDTILAYLRHKAAQRREPTP